MPENWKTYKLEDLASIKGGKRMPKGVALIETPTDHPYIRVTDMGQRRVPLNQLLYVPDQVFDKISRYIVSKDDVILSIVGTIGAVAMISDELHKANLTENCVKLTELKNVHHSFLYYFFKSTIGQNEIAKGIVGSTQPKLPLYNIQKIEINLPPLQEQKSIASILSALDDKIELNLQMNKILEEMAMALYKHWFVDFGPFQDGEFVDSELGEIPKGWEVKGILELTDLLSGGTPKTKIAEYWDGTVNWVSAKDIGNGGNIYISDTEKKITEKGVQNSSTKILPSDTVILVARGSVGKFGMIAKPMAMNQSCYGLFSKGELSHGLVYLMCSNLIEQFKRVSYGSVFDTITTSTFKATKVVSPPSAVIKELKGLIDPLFLELKNNIFENQTLTQLRDTLLPKLISGEVRVKDVEKTLSKVL